ncbi:MAG: hypothetical protein AAGC74_06575 [Verrucomicrobiota bacterium]
MKTLIQSVLFALLTSFGVFGQEGRGGEGGGAREFGMAMIPFGEGEISGVDVFEFRRTGVGASLVFGGEPGRDYMVWCSEAMGVWQYGDMAGCVAPGVYSAHVECCAQWQRAFFLVVELQQGQIVNQGTIEEGLSGGVPLFDELEDIEKAVLEVEIRELTEALVAVAEAQGELERKRRERASCLEQVERLRLEVEAATQQADAAIAWREIKEAEFEEANGHKADMEDRLASKREELAEWQEYAAREIPMLEAAKANASTAEQAAQLQREIDFIDETTERREGRVELAERDLRDAEERLEGPQQDYEDALVDEAAQIQDEHDAWSAYQEAKELCDPKAAEVADAERAVKEAEGKVEEETEDYNQAAATANEQAEANRKRKEEEEAEQLRVATAEELERRAEQDERAQDELERKLGEWKKFFDRIRELGGEEEAKKAADEIALKLKIGTETGRLMATALKALALGKTVSQAMQGFTAAGMRLGYTALVEYAAGVAKAAVANVLRGRAAEIMRAEADTMKAGESRFYTDETENSEGRTTAVITRNADGSITVTSWTKSTLGAAGGFREDVFLKESRTR